MKVKRTHSIVLCEYCSPCCLECVGYSVEEVLKQKIVSLFKTIRDNFESCSVVPWEANDSKVP